MKSLISQFFSPISTAIVIVHWLVVVFAVYGESHTEPFHFYYEPLLTQVLVLINFLPLIVGSFLYTAALMLVGESVFASSIGVFCIISAVSLQWFLIGSLINYVVNHRSSISAVEN